MSLPHQHALQLRTAVSEYDFPAKVWTGQPHSLGTTAEVETHIQSSLNSIDDEQVRIGLVSVVCWGWGNTSLCQRRSDVAAQGITAAHIQAFRLYRTRHPEGDIRALAKLKLPQLGQMSFGTKVLAFLHPDTRAVLDKKIAEVLNATTFVAEAGGPIPIRTNIPITSLTAKQYDTWCQLCTRGAAQLGANYRAVDFERAIFRLAQTGKHALARECMNALLADD